MWNWKATYFATPLSVSVGVCLLSPPIKSADRKEAARKGEHLHSPCAHFSWAPLVTTEVIRGARQHELHRGALQARGCWNPDMHAGERSLTLYMWLWYSRNPLWDYADSFKHLSVILLDGLLVTDPHRHNPATCARMCVCLNVTGCRFNWLRRLQYLRNLSPSLLSFSSNSLRCLGLGPLFYQEIGLMRSQAAPSARAKKTGGGRSTEESCIMSKKGVWWWRGAIKSFKRGR